LNEALQWAGFFVLAFDSYPVEIRVSACVTTRAWAIRDEGLSNKTHVLISLDDKESLSRVPFLAREAMVLFDNRPSSYVETSASIAAHVEPEVRLFGMPFGELAAAASGSTRGRNLAALGGFAALFSVPPQYFHEVITKKFKGKGEKTLNANLKSFDAGYRYAAETFQTQIMTSLAPSERAGEEDKILISGSEAIARGALDAGIKLYFGYPITPATTIMEYLAKTLPERGGRVVQMEDEISSIGAVLGSFYAGKRAMTATSGPGFSLMTELITHGIMSETPAVIIDAQRGGPATGLPSKTEQSDLHAAVFGGPGDSSRIVIAPTNVRECYEYTLRSFQLAEKYQIPVIVLTDFFLNNRVEKVSIPDPDEADRADWNIYPEPSSQERYSRYRITESGILPVPFQEWKDNSFQCHGPGTYGEGHPDYSPETT
jgi:2-oxoglutarate ferredoxin oxidoreductase subunit alpha